MHLATHRGTSPGTGFAQNGSMGGSLRLENRKHRATPTRLWPTIRVATEPGTAMRYFVAQQSISRMWRLKNQVNALRRRHEALTFDGSDNVPDHWR